MRIFLLIAALASALALAPGVRAAPPATVQQEVDFLLGYIGHSACEFKRNGTWNDAAAAEAHMRSKYEFLIRMGWIETTGDFIDRAATESSMSGQPYEIRCAGGPPVASSRWLREALSHYRETHPAN